MPCVLPYRVRSRGAGLTTDEQNVLLARLRRGERSAMEETARLFGNRLLQLAHRLLGYNGDAADVVQEVFAKMLAKPNCIGGGHGQLENWLLAVTANECRSQLRRIRAAWRMWRGIVWTTPTEYEPEDREIHQQVRRAVQKLSPRDREVIVLHHLEQMPISSIAQMLRLSHNAVEVRLHRARGRLKTLLDGRI
jgi:RNA polymerase sigma factor (sigma-70 family)